MKETSFIQQNKKKWARFEKLSGQKTNDPDEVSSLFTEITEDLSYARTFYPRRSVRVYLNQLAQGVFTSLYKQRKQPLGNVFKFWTESVPLEMYRARFSLLTAFLFFGLAVIIGAVSQHYDSTFVEVILGEGYVQDTEERIRQGNPMGVYGEQSETGMFLQITMNNIRVAFIAFALGIFGTLGTYILLLGNGIMLGCFQWWFKAKGLLLTSFLAVWIHGAFEISSIIIAGAAGITLGKGLLFPKSFTRVQSLIFAAKRGLSIMLSLVPFFIIAGFLESFVTRHYQVMHPLLKWTIIISSFAIIVLYFVVYPIIIARRHPDKLEIREVPRYIPDRKIEWQKIRKVGEVFTDTFYLFLKHAGKIFSLFFAFILIPAIALTAFIYAQEFARFDFELDMMGNLQRLFGIGYYASVYKFVGWSFLLAILFCNVYYVIQADEEEPLYTGFGKFLVKKVIWMWIFSAIIFALFVFAPMWVILLSLFLAPFFGMIPAIIVYEKKDFFSSAVSSANLGKGAYGDSLGSFAIFLLIFFIFKFALENPMGGIFSEFDLVSMIDNVIKDMTVTVFDRYAVIISFVNSLLFLVFLFIMFSVYALSFSFSYHSSNEMKTAGGLYDRLNHFGKRNKRFETEVDYD